MDRDDFKNKVESATAENFIDWYNKQTGRKLGSVDKIIDA